MSFDSLEKSQQDSNYFELYLFQFVISGLKYAMSTGQEQYTYSGNLYLPSYIKRGDLVFENENENSGIVFTIATEELFVQQAIGLNVKDKVKVTVYRVQRDEDVVATLFIGYVDSLTVSGETSEAECVPSSTYLSRVMLHRKYTKICPYVLYDGSTCRADSSLYQTNGVINGIPSANSVTSTLFSAQSDDYFTNGYLQIGSYKYAVVNHTGNTCVLHTPLLSAVEIGDIVFAVAGCNKIMTTCKDRFNNLNNFGGFPWIPKKNPFSGDSIL